MGFPLFRDFLRLFFPKLCAGCRSALRTNESHICTNCRLNLPETLFGFDNENATAKVFWGRLPVTSAISLLHFQKGSVVQQIMHELKYNGNRYVGIELGQLLGSRIKQSAEALPDVIVPVPLHPKRERKRGYNQSLMIAQGVSEATGIPINHSAVIRNTHTKTQTKKGREARWENVSTIFLLKDPSALQGKHVLLLDDVLTTGATLEALGHEVMKAGNVQVSVATIALA
jgi:ComF family protein